MKNKLLSFLSVLLILAGLLLVSLPKISSYIIDKRTKEIVTVVEDISAETLQENLEKASEFDFDRIFGISPTHTFSATNTVNESLMIGRLIIPTIDLNLTVFNGMTNPILHAGVGTMRPHLKMGAGNFPIAGHYSSREKTLFGDLDGLKTGDLIYLTDNEQIYEYQVYDTRVVEPTEVHWIEDDIAKQHGKPIISLMNCYFVDGVYTEKRYFVFAELIDTHAANEMSN